MAQQQVEFQAKVDESCKGEEVKKPSEERNDEHTEEKSEDKKQSAEKEQQNSQQKLQQAPTSLFGSLGQPNQNNFTNLFNNSGVQLKESIFNNAKSGLFSTTNTTLFPQLDLSKPGQSLFGLNLQPQKGSDESEGEGDEGQEEAQKSDEDEPKQIIMKYEYNQNTNQLMKANVEKFRKNQNDVLEKGSVAIEKALDQDAYFLIYRNQIQQNLYTGQLIKEVSQISPLGQKIENILLKTVSRQEGQDQKLSIDKLKIMFSNQEGCEQFKEQFYKLFK